MNNDSRRVCRMSIVALSAVAVVVAHPVPTAARAEPPDRQVWTVDLATVDADDTHVVSGPGGLALDPLAGSFASERTGRPAGTFTAAPHVFAAPANRIRANLAATVPTGSAVELDVRGRHGDRWSPWTPVDRSAVLLDQQVSVVQVRLSLSAPPNAPRPTVHSLQLVADVAAAMPAAAPAPAASYTVFATREGLVGGTTANGHVIVDRDHFVALPSRRGLSPRGSGDYTVRVCAASNRCEYAPVWDVGPWNTRDDHWSPSQTRQMWNDLPQGLPQAQAAYQNRYNGGRDQFGRTVANPAGIDLADGTFWDGLQLTDNSWVTVSYLFTAAGPRGVVDTGGVPLNVRTGPGTTFGITGLAANRAHVPIECTVSGQRVTGPHRTTTQWNRIAAGHYVSHAYVASVVGGTPAECPGIAG